MSALVHCIYSSVQTHPLSSAELAQLVKESREKNRKRGITGLLLNVDRTFFQILEGHSDQVEALYAKILVDPRHQHIIRIIFEPIARRFFSDTDMTLAMLSPDEVSHLLQDGDRAQREDLLSGLDEGRAKRLLRAFADGRWRVRIGSAPPEVVPA